MGYNMNQINKHLAESLGRCTKLKQQVRVLKDRERQLQIDNKGLRDELKLKAGKLPFVTCSDCGKDITDGGFTIIPNHYCLDCAAKAIGIPQYVIDKVKKEQTDG